MIKAIQYKANDTAIHRLNPAVKLAWGTVIVILCLIFDNPIYTLAFLLPLVIVINTAGIWRQWVSALKLSLWLGASIIIINVLMSYHGSHALVSAPFILPVLGRPIITMEALAFGAEMALKLVLIIAAFSFINLTVHPDDILSVSLKLKIPYKSVLVVSLSTRFIPCLIEDVERINQAYQTRGVKLDTGSWLERLKNRSGIAIPLIMNSLDRAVQTAEAMEARAFGSGPKRVFYREIRLSRLDMIILSVTILPLVTGIILRVYGYGSFQFFPTINNPYSSFLGLVLPGIIGLLLLLIIPFSLLKRRIELD